jgi:hypothetical protein
VVALADSDPQKKADWIEDKIKKGYDDVFFIDDSHKNVEAVGALKKKYPDIKLKAQHVKHETPTAPKTNFKHGEEEKTDKPADITKLKSMIPKNDMDKTVKNPDTGRKIKVTSALGYDKKSAVYRAAMNLLKRK